MKKFYFLFLVYAAFISVAQTPYELFNSKSELFFNKPGVNELVGLKPDSTKLFATDSIYYHYRIVANATGSCSVNGRAISWLGQRTVRTVNNDFIFFNQQNDSIIIKPLMPLNASWIYYRYPNGDYIKATVSLRQIEATFDGLSDTVKTISFQAYNSSDAPITNLINSKLFKIARTLGVIKMGNIYNFPADTAVCSRCFGKRLTVKDITDHNVGDILQRFDYSGTMNQPNSPNNKSITTIRYLSKASPNINTAVYTVSVTVNTTKYHPYSGYTYTTTTGTQTLTEINLNNYVDKQMPQQFRPYGQITPTNNIVYGSKIVYNGFKNSGNCQSRFGASYYTCILMTGSSDSCLGPSVSCPDGNNFAYYYGLGYYSGQGSYSGSPLVYGYPIYSNAINLNCGAMDITNLKKNLLDSDFTLSPNPVRENLKISNDLFNNILEINIVDLMGKEVILVKPNNNFNPVINVSELKNGIYFLRIKTESGQVSKKFIKE